MTPESQGGALRGGVELQVTQGHELTLITNHGRVDEGVTYNTISRTGYQLSNSFFDSFDVVWTHIASGNSLAGGKLQFLGDPRTAKAAGHKLAGVLLFGGNTHETGDKSVKFRLDGQEMMLIYGYRINEFVMPYLNVAQSTYKWDAVITSQFPELNGQEPKITTNIRSFNGGAEFNLESFFAKTELSYQQIDSSDTKAKTALSFGFSGGINW